MCFLTASSPLWTQCTKCIYQSTSSLSCSLKERRCSKSTSHLIQSIHRNPETSERLRKIFNVCCELHGCSGSFDVHHKEFHRRRRRDNYYAGWCFLFGNNPGLRKPYPSARNRTFSCTEGYIGFYSHSEEKEDNK
jgi:hypothetical protein